MKGITFDTIQEAKKYGDQMYERGYNVDIQKKGKGKFVVVTSSPKGGAKPAKPKTTGRKKGKGKENGGDGGFDTSLLVDRRMLKKSMGRRMRTEKDLTLGGNPSNPHLYDPTKGGQRARIAQLPEFK